MKFAYADPPYFGQGRKHYSDLHPAAGDCDRIAWHEELIAKLVREYPDGWALSLSSPSLQRMLPFCPGDVRIAAWCKSFCSFKPNVNPAYSWEPVIWRGGRKRERFEDKVRDFAVIPITLKAGFPGAKPPRFMRWILDLFNANRSDTVDDLFPGSGACTKVIQEWQSERSDRSLVLSL